MAYWLLAAYCILILMASLAGGALPLMMRLTHTTMQFSVSFVAGVMLGVGFLHMLPHALKELGDPGTTMLWILGGFLLMFFIQRYLAVHQHLAPHEQTASEHQCGETDEAHHHAHEDVPSTQTSELLTKKMSWSGAALGLSLHSLLNGIALAAAVENQAKQVPWAGGAIFLAIVIHKPFDSLTITTLMSAAGWSRFACHVMNGLFSLAIPLGVGCFYLGLFAAGATVMGSALAVSAGVFICIAASDLLPEMQFHSHDREQLSFWLLAGVGVAFLVEYLPRAR
jgi:zinc and cadmium transporter